MSVHVDQISNQTAVFSNNQETTFEATTTTELTWFDKVVNAFVKTFVIDEEFTAADDAEVWASMSYMWWMC